MYVICDTNIFIHLFKNDAATIAVLEKIGTRNILMSAVAEMELCRGARNQAELKLILKNLDNYSIIDIDIKTCLVARNLVREYHLSHGLQIPDALIAASAIAYQLPLFTYNTKDFRFIKKLELHTY